MYEIQEKGGGLFIVGSWNEDGTFEPHTICFGEPDAANLVDELNAKALKTKTQTAHSPLTGQQNLPFSEN